MMLVRATLLGAVVIAGLAGCSSPAPAPAASIGASRSPSAVEPTPVSTSSPSATPSPAASDAVNPNGNARDNRDYFDSVMKKFFDDKPKRSGRAIVDKLEAAGFDKSAMELTPDKTAIDLEADAIEFSVKFGETCLVGQKGAEFGYKSVALPILDSGSCLLGETRTIDW